MADESQINTFTLSVKLPIDDASPPNIFFKVSLNCNGIVTTSDAFSNVDDALEWAQDELPTFGTWSVSDNTLYLSDCLCGVGSLYLTVTSLDQGGDVGGNVLALDDSNPQAILDIWGLAAVDVSVNKQRSTDTAWKAKVSALTPLFIEPVTGTTSWWPKYMTPSDGYNIQASEGLARTPPQTLAQILDGIGNTTYGYGFFEDALAYMGDFGTIPSVIVALDLFRPMILGSYTTTFGEIDYIVSKCASEGITIRSFQLCYELGILNADDFFPTAASVQTATQTIGNYITANYPAIAWSIDAYPADDTSRHKPTLNSLQNAVTGNTLVRQYFQFDEDLVTYEQLRERIAGFPSFVSKFTQEFTHGQKMRIAQSTFKIGNPFRDKFAEALVYAELIINVINQNILYSNRIADFVQFNLSRVVASDASEQPSYQTLLKMRGAMNNDGKIEATFTNENLEILAVKSGSSAEIYILNHSSDFQSFDSVALNGVAKNVTVNSDYNDPSADESNRYSDAGTSVLLYPHSVTLVTTT